jgi:hypothetical protein
MVTLGLTMGISPSKPSSGKSYYGLIGYSLNDVKLWKWGQSLIINLASMTNKLGEINN